MAREEDGSAQERCLKRTRWGRDEGKDALSRLKFGREERSFWRREKGAGEIRLSDSERRGSRHSEANACKLDREAGKCKRWERDERRQREEDARSRLKFGNACRLDREANASRLDREAGKCKQWERDERRQREEDGRSRFKCGSKEQRIGVKAAGAITLSSGRAGRGRPREENACRLDREGGRDERREREDARVRLSEEQRHGSFWQRDKGAGEIMLREPRGRGDRPGRSWHREENTGWHKQRNWSRRRQREEGVSIHMSKSKEKCRPARQSLIEETKGNGGASLWKHHNLKVEEPSKKRRRMQSKVTMHATKQQDWGWHLNKAGAGVEAEAALREQCLPFHVIVEHILVRLPVRQLCQLRCVCKAWNSLLTQKANEFLKVEEEEYWFVSLSASKSLGVFSTRSICHPLPLPNSKLLSYLGGGISRLASGWHCPEFYLLASAGGLMCAIVRATAGFEVIVFNCLTGSLKVLPQPLDVEFLFGTCEPCQIYIAVDSEDSRRYYIVLIHSLLSILRHDFYYFEVFDSKFGSWKVGQTAKSATVKSSGMKVRHGDFFVVGGDATSGVVNVQAYHVAQDVWSTVQVPCDTHTMDPRAFLKYK